MEKKDRLLYNYSNCEKNFDKETIDKFITGILYVDKDDIPNYLYDIKKVYNLNNYMYILERINNYLVELFSKTYGDYCVNNRDFADYQVLNNIGNRNHKVLNAYNYELKQKQDTPKIKKFRVM